MSLSSPFIKRPIATTLLALGLAFAGIVAFKFLPVAPLPNIDFPTISVQASLPGASPEIMATSVATPLERQIGLIAGVTELTSTSTLGNVSITVQFDLSRNIDGAARDIQAAINAARAQLPPNLPNNPTYRKINPADAPILILALTSDIFSVGQMYDAASTILQQKLSQVDGVGQVIVGGSSLPAVRVELNPTALNSYGISLESVRQTIAATNINRPKGQLMFGNSLTTIVSNDQMFKPEDYRPIIIGYHNNAPVTLADVGEVEESIQDIRTAGFTDGKPSVVLVIFKQPGANIITTVDKVRSTLPFLKASIPSTIDMTVAMDRTTTIRASLQDVEITLLIAIALVILVVYLFLGSKRAALVPSVAVPLSLLGTFALMYLFDFTLDNLSLMALTIVTGFVVDDAVVVLENITRHIENGMKPMAAALLGAKEVGFTVLSMSTSLIAVFIPLLFMGGIVGRLFFEFAMTLSIAIFVSMLVSLTVTPMMSARLLKSNGSQAPEDSAQKNILSGTSSKKYILKLRDKYEKSLDFALKHSFLMLILTIFTLLFTIFLYIIIPKGFFPQQDTGRIVGAILAQQDLSFQATQEKLKQFISIIKQDKGVDHVVGFVGGTVPSGKTGSVFITLKPRSERSHSSDQIIARLRSEMSEVTGATTYLQSAQDLVIGGRLGNAQFQYSLVGNDLNTLDNTGPRVMETLSKIPGIVDLNTDQRNQGLELFVNIDRATAARFGISTRLIDNTLYDAFGQEQVSVMYTERNQYYVVMEVAPPFWQNPNDIQNIYVNSSAGKQVPLASFANFKPNTTFLAVNHQGQFPSVTLSFNLAPGYSLGDVVDSINAAELNLPSGISGSFSGTAQAFQSSLSTQPFLILAALFAVYIILGILYESLIHPVTILSTLPSAGLGALLALLITGTELSLIAVIGIILLIGIVKKNAIMMIDFALHLEREQKKSPKEAILQAAVLRFRPIMMTTMAALLAAFPLALGLGVGSELRRPLGIAIIGGLIVSQMLTLFTTPVIYLYMERARLWFKRNARKNTNISPLLSPEGSR